MPKEISWKIGISLYVTVCNDGSIIDEDFTIDCDSEEDALKQFNIVLNDYVKKSKSYNIGSLVIALLRQNKCVKLLRVEFENRKVRAIFDLAEWLDYNKI